MAELALNNIFINYFGARDVIHSFTHTFTGGLNVIYGAEGSGKTTLLKAIAGLVHIKEGSIQLDGKEYSEVRIREKGIAMVFDDLALRNRRCVRYNLELPLRLRKFAPEIIRERVGAVSAEFGLSSGIMDVAVFRLSEEYKVRIALARAFMRESKILIFDNPFARLSPDIREELFLLLLGHIRKSETVVIYATDSSREAEMTLADTVILSYGYLTESGLPADFRNAPKTASTAETFIKYSSSYNINLEQRGNFNLLGSKLSLADNIKNRLIGSNYLGKEVIIVVPPYAVTTEICIDNSHNKSTIGIVTNLISTPQGNLAIITVNGDTINAYVDDKIIISDSVKVCIDTSKIFLFDCNNENTILK